MTSGKYFDTIAELNSDPSVDMEGWMLTTNTRANTSSENVSKIIKP